MQGHLKLHDADPHVSSLMGRCLGSVLVMDPVMLAAALEVRWAL